MGSNIRVEHIKGSVPNDLKCPKGEKTGNNKQMIILELIWYVTIVSFVSIPLVTSNTPQAMSTATVPYKPGLLPSFIRMKYLLTSANQNDDKDGLSAILLGLMKTIDFHLFPETFAGVNHEFEHFLDFRGLEAFVQLCEECIALNLSMANVPSHWFLRREEYPELDSPEYGAMVKSLINLQPSVLSMQLNNLESLKISLTTRSTPGMDWREKRVDWPSLKSLDITVDAAYSVAWYHYPETEEESERDEFPLFPTEELFRFLFHDITRPSLAELRLDFLHRKPLVTIPKVEDIISSCPYLKKLTIANWPGTNKELAKLWDGLPELEEISLENCTGLSIEAFVGEDLTSPVFLKLKELKKFSLKGLDKMTKITDSLFTLVIRHLELTHFTLTSYAPVKTVTEAAIESLLDGEFAESIEEFSFKGWSLASASKEKLMKIEAKFRLHNLYTPLEFHH